MITFDWVIVYTLIALVGGIVIGVCLMVPRDRMRSARRYSDW